MSDSETDLTGYRLTQIEKTLAVMSASLQQLTSLEQKHTETMTALAAGAAKMSDHEMRLRVVEGEMPTMKMIRSWVILGVLGVVGILGTAVVKLFVLH
jgi:hypothetical protein